MDKNKLLIVDDSMVNLNLLAELLKDKGYQLAFAQSAKETYKVLENFLPDLILLDIMMPEVDGYQVCEKLKSDEKTKKIPVIFITAKNDEKGILQAYSVGGVDYVTKPFFVKELLARIETHLNLKNSYDTIYDQSINLKIANDIKTKVFSVISHDMRTPLASIQILLDNLLSSNNFCNTELLVSSLQHIQVAANDTSQLLDNLLFWSRNQLNTLKSTPVYFDIISAIQNTIEIYQFAASKKSLSINLKYKSEILVFADEEMIKSIMRNLLTNAIKFSNKGKDINIYVKKKNGLVQVLVEDFGKGMTDEEVKKIYEGGYHTTLGTHGEKGTGLGLGLCKTFIGINRGDFWIESKKEKGSKFYVTIPSRK